MALLKVVNGPIGSGNRVLFLDNLRALFVIGVVIQHASMAYNWSDWWPVVDESSLFPALLTAFFDGFLMPSLFFISGYFAIPSIRNRSVPAFISGKLRRLGFPWLVCIMLICPVLPLLYHFSRDSFGVSVSYWETWQALMGKALQVEIGIMPPMNQVMQNDLFYQRYMWFVSLLLAFFLIFALVYRLKPGWFQFNEQSPGLSGRPIRSTLKTLLAIGLITFIGSTILTGLMFAVSTGVSNPESWFTLGNLIQFRVSRIFLHVTYFILGIWTFGKGWIQSGRFPGHPKTCGVAFTVSLIAYYISLFMMKMASGEMQQLLGMVFWLCLNFFTISTLTLFLSLGGNYLNRPSQVGQNLASHSYQIYLGHYVFVLICQLVFTQVPALPVEIKFLSVALLSTAGAWSASRFLVKPYPRLTVGILVIAFFLMVLAIHP